MKKKLVYFIAAVGVMTMTQACRDENAIPGVEIPEIDFSSENMSSAIFLNGNAVVGKTVKYTPTGNGTANIIIAGEPLNIGDLIGGMTYDETGATGISIPTPGVLPGSPSVTIPVQLKGSETECTFEGVDETDYCTFSYSGKVSEQNLTLNLSDVKLKNTSLAGTWNLNSFADPETGSENFYNILRLEWDADSLANIELFPGAVMSMPIGTIAKLALVAYPMLDPDENGNPTKNVAQMLNYALKSVTFGEDGNITAKYTDFNKADRPEVESPVGFAQYVIADDNTIRLYLNPAAIIASTMSKARMARSLDINALIEGLMTNVVPMLANGIPVQFGPQIYNDEKETTDASTSFYLGTSTLLPILKTIAPVLQDEDIIAALVAMIKEDPSFKDMAGMFEGILKSLPDVIDTTSKIEVGINMTKAE